MEIIDSHVHVFPDRVGDLLKGSPAAPVADVLQGLKRKGREKLAPLRQGLHGLQPFLRHVPENLRRKTDGLSYTSVFSNLLLESSPTDLLDAMKARKVGRALVIAAPPHASNDFILGLAAQHPTKLVPVVNIPPGDSTPLRSLVDRGAKALKIHAATDGHGPHSPHYLRLLQEARELGLPVILHTGCIHMKLVYKDPEMGRAERFDPWFKAFPELKFVLAHMNFHDPGEAFTLCQRYPQLYLDTSWQPASVIRDAFVTLGPERVMFGSDWPLVGDNMAVGLDRIKECQRKGGGLSKEGAKLVLAGNARRVFGLD